MRDKLRRRRLETSLSPAKHTNFIFDALEQKAKEVKAGTSEEVNILTANILIMAPEGFFLKYEKLVEKITNYIQDAMSRNGNQAGLINALKQDPTNQSLAQEAFKNINSHFLTNESTESDPLYHTLSQIEIKLVLALVFNEICGLGPLEPLFRSTDIKEIVCNGPYDIQVEIDGKMLPVKSCRFRDAGHLQNLIDKLYNSINKIISRSTPMERARLHDNSRIFAVHDSVALNGPSLNIRRHTDNWISPDFLISKGSASEPLMNWLGHHINQGLNFLVVGGTSSGKTSLLGALTGFYRNNVRILTVERNIELKGAPNKLWGTPMEVIPAKAGSISSGVSMRDLVEATTQMRPDGIIVGETTGEEAFDLLQALNTGHFGASTIHANTAEDSIPRLVSLVSQADMIKGEAIYDLIIAAFDLVVVTTRFPEDGSRKIEGIYEIGSEVKQTEAGVLYVPVSPIWKFILDSNEDNIIRGHWEQVGELSEFRTKKHNLQHTPIKPWNELKELYMKKPKYEE